MEQNGETKKMDQECPNCGQALREEDRFCPQCGQRNHDLRLPLKHLFQEVFEGLFHFEHRSLQTLKHLVFSPGMLTKEFIAGRRMRYVAPIRFYVFISVLFFFVMSLPSHQETKNEHSGNKMNITYYAIQSSHLSGLEPSQADSVLTAVHMEPTAWNRYMVRQLIRLQNEGQEQFNHMLVKSLSYMMFILMPLFAAMLYVLYRKQAQQYIGTLIFSVHFHTFIFFIFSIAEILQMAGAGGWSVVIALLWCPIYLFLALRNIYGGTRFWTFLKTVSIGVFQIVALAMLFFYTAIISVLLF